MGRIRPLEASPAKRAIKGDAIRDSFKNHLGGRLDLPPDPVQAGLCEQRGLNAPLRRHFLARQARGRARAGRKK
jgi:hypothetical protein